MTIDRPGIYMFAIVPPEPIYSEIQDFKAHFANEYKARGALNKPAHITIIPPFEIPTNKENDLISFSKSACTNYSPFEILLDGFGEFHQDVIYSKPLANQELTKLQKDLSKSFASRFRRINKTGASSGFHPHITIAYRDLSRAMFDLAWREFEHKLYRRRFMLDHICLMRHFTKWTTIGESRLGGGTQIEELSLFG